MIRLFLASEVKHPDSIMKLMDYTGGLTGKKIAYIPTAANAEGWGSWKEGGSWKLVQTLDAEVEVVQLEDYRNASVIKRLRGKDIIWFAGGYCGYLMYWIMRTEIDKHLRRLLKSGTLYVGSSAGAMIAGPALEISEWYHGEGERGASMFPGLGLVQFDFYPHYEESAADYIKSHYKGKNLYLLKNGEELIVEDDKVTVIGKTRIINGFK